MTDEIQRTLHTDMSVEDQAAFYSAHDRLMALKGSSEVKDLVERLVSGVDGFTFFLQKLLALPSVQSALAQVNAGASAGIGTLVAGATPPPFGLLTGPAAAAAAKFVGAAIVTHLEGLIGAPS